MEADEKFFAWLDGELNAEEAAEVERRVSASPELARLAAEHCAMQERLKRAFGTVADAPVPEQVRAAVRPPSGQVINLDSVRSTRGRREWGSLPRWSAIAATLAVGILVGTLIPERASGPVAVRGGALYAAAPLNRALDTQLASAPSGDVRIGLTFRNQAGAICRTFTEPAASGLACRNDGRWKLEGLFAAPEGQSSDYRMAGGMDPNLAALVDSTMSAEPFDAAQEKAAKTHGWR